MKIIIKMQSRVFSNHHQVVLSIIPFVVGGEIHEYEIFLVDYKRHKYRIWHESILFGEKVKNGNIKKEVVKS